MDPNAAYQAWWRAVLEENASEARNAYEALRGWIEMGGFEPDAFSNTLARKQFFRFSPRTGRID